MGFDLLKGPNPSYLVLKFGNILPIINWDMAKGDFVKVMTFKGEGHRAQ